MKRVCTYGIGHNRCDGAVRGQPTPMCPPDCEFLTRTFAAEVTEGEAPPSLAASEPVDWEAKYKALKQDYGPAEGPPCPGEGWYWVRGHWRSRRVACQEIPDTSVESCENQAAPTGDTADGGSGALAVSGEARGASCAEAPARIVGEE